MTLSSAPDQPERSIDAVQTRLAALPRLNLPTQWIALREALGRVLAEPLVSPIAVPSAPTSAMDGYALAGQQLGSQALMLPIVGRALAGHPWSGAVPAGACVRIMTGALVPDGCDTVIPQELCTATGSTLHVPAAVPIRHGQHCRQTGEDLVVGARVLEAGRVIRSTDLALLASLGFAQIPVRRRLRVAFFSTGDELQPLGAPLAPGQIYDSNRYALYALLERQGIEIIDLGVIADEPEAIERALTQAAAEADAIVTSGGVSVGDADFTRPMMARLGQVDFFAVAMRPGRPFAFGRVWASEPRQGTGVALFALPGNPVAVVVSFLMLVRDALWHLQDAVPPPVPRVTATLTHAVRKRPGRTEFLRARLVTHNGITLAEPAAAQGAAALMSLSAADGLVVLNDAQSDLEAGDTVQVLPFVGLL